MMPESYVTPYVSEQVKESCEPVDLTLEKFSYPTAGDNVGPVHVRRCWTASVLSSYKNLSCLYCFRGG